MDNNISPNTNSPPARVAPPLPPFPSFAEFVSTTFPGLPQLQSYEVYLDWMFHSRIPCRFPMPIPSAPADSFQDPPRFTELYSVPTEWNARPFAPRPAPRATALGTIPQPAHVVPTLQVPPKPSTPLFWSPSVPQYRGIAQVPASVPSRPTTPPFWAPSLPQHRELDLASAQYNPHPRVGPRLPLPNPTLPRFAYLPPPPNPWHSVLPPLPSPSAMSSALVSIPTPPGPCTTFHDFKRLPMELQLRVWKFALPAPRIVKVISRRVEEIDTERWDFQFAGCSLRRPPDAISPRFTLGKSSAKIPDVYALLGTCKVSREVSEKAYNVCIVSEGLSSRHQLLLDGSRDTLYLANSSTYELPVFGRFGSSLAPLPGFSNIFRGVKKLAILSQPLPKLDFHMFAEEIEHSEEFADLEETMECILQPFPDLQQLTIFKCSPFYGLGPTKPFHEHVLKTPEAEFSSHVKLLEKFQAYMKKSYRDTPYLEKIFKAIGHGDIKLDFLMFAKN